MNRVTYKCSCCGKEVEEEMLALGHAVKGYGMKINSQADCCQDPSYVDEEGRLDPKDGNSILDILPSIRA